MGRKTRIRLVGKPAAFDVEKWARAVEALAQQLRREWQETGQYPAPPEVTDDEEPVGPC